MAEFGGILRTLLIAAFAVLANGAALHAQEESSRLTGIKLSSDEPIQIESDRLEVRDNERKAIFSGNVSVVQGKTLLKSGRMIVHYAKGGGSVTTGSSDIERLEVDGKVYVKSEDQVATGDQGTFDMKSEVLVLTGEKVVLSEGDNVIVGCKLTVQMKSGKARFDGCDKGSSQSGRIIMQIDPKSRKE
ncbi:MAG: LptA/OstA family protein [Rhizobiaceae bacterium]